MGISTSTGTLTAGQSRTFNLSPASAVTLTFSPNVRVTITETPSTVAATGLGGNASRVHEPRLPGVVTYGPYPMGGSVLVENESNSGSSVAWVRSDSIVAESADGSSSLVDGAGNTYAIAEERVDVVNRRAVFDGGVIPDNRKRAIVKTKTVTNSDNSDYIEPTRDRRIVMALDSNTATSTITATGGQSIALFAAAAAAGFRWDEPNRPFRYISAGAQASGAVVTVKEVA